MMKDIDFDELDRAVNSLMKGVPQDDDDDTKAVQSGDTAKEESAAVVEKSETVQPQDEIVDEIQLAPPSDLMIIDEPDDEPEEEGGNETPSVSAASNSPAASLPTVRRGRFMDMVRSSAPAREVAAPAPSVRPSRQGPTLQPVTSLRPSAPKPSFGEGVSMGGWPIEPPTRNAPEKAAPLVQPTEPITPVSTPETGPPVLPFLPDAKVEKRPLGRPAEASPPAPVVPEMPEMPLETSSQIASTDFAAAANANGTVEMAPQEDEDAQLPGQPLPAELGSELLSIETGADTVQEQTPPITPTAMPAQPASNSLHIPGVARPMATMAAASIPQQYKLQPKQENDGPEAAGAMYDAANYHQPLTHPAKKMPGWLWVVAIVIILLLGAAGGAAVYYFGLKG